jgi:deazaflavin-dependent oxidoreductase (nitroreductase family)
VHRVRRAWFWLLRHTLNPLTTRLAASGHGPFSLIRHVGRKTGRRYATPLLLAKVPEGFVAELTYGEDVAWYQNVMAAGTAELLVGGVIEHVVAIEPYPTDDGRRAFGFPARIVLTLLRRRSFRLLRTA